MTYQQAAKKRRAEKRRQDAKTRAAKRKLRLDTAKARARKEARATATFPLKEVWRSFGTGRAPARFTHVYCGRAEAQGRLGAASIRSCG